MRVFVLSGLGEFPYSALENTEIGKLLDGKNSGLDQAMIPMPALPNNTATIFARRMVITIWMTCAPPTTVVDFTILRKELLFSGIVFFSREMLLKVRGFFTDLLR